MGKRKVKRRGKEKGMEKEKGQEMGNGNKRKGKGKGNILMKRVRRSIWESERDGESEKKSQKRNGIGSERQREWKRDIVERVR